MSESAAASPPSPFPSLAAVSAGLLAAFVGFASSFAVAVQGLMAVGATQAEAASGLMALLIGKAVFALMLSWRLRMPVSVAWSTPGAALLVATGAVAGGFPAAVGGFLVSGVLIVLAGTWKPLGRAVSAIPTPLASAMLGGVLFGLCTAPVRAVAENAALGLPIVLAWAVVARVNRLLAVPAAVLVAAVLIAATTRVTLADLGPLAPHPILVTPTLTLQAVTAIAIPLFIVTMASQNIPGIAILAVNGYRPDPGLLFRATGLASILVAPFGGHALNLAAITAALCAGPDADSDPRRRWWAAAVAACAYLGFGLTAVAATAFLGASPPILIQAVAGLALLGSLGAALTGAVADPKRLEAAIVTFVVTASGVSFLGIGGALWGLVAGGAMLALARWRG
ncbi:benzoate/H(+) symporter BenE family transporter [Prosthecomicrobium sp. N25]|uniref:benzoate/H(+) symporter BenE family transporter n=1 Tax=Prosthecomicrobium sp. N25 TaxID=3129254 RepID=UPI0030789B34